MLYKGSCHCGKAAFEVEGELTAALRCNCSICSRKRALLWAVPHGTLRVLAWGDDLGSYTFGNHVIAHRFGRDVSEGNERSAYVNVNCLDDLDLDAVPVIDFDGRAV
jgi:hypothetical protein